MPWRGSSFHSLSPEWRAHSTRIGPLRDDGCATLTSSPARLSAWRTQLALSWITARGGSAEHGSSADSSSSAAPKTAARVSWPSGRSKKTVRRPSRPKGDARSSTGGGALSGEVDEAPAVDEPPVPSTEIHRLPLRSVAGMAQLWSVAVKLQALVAVERTARSWHGAPQTTGDAAFEDATNHNGLDLARLAPTADTAKCRPCLKTHAPASSAPSTSISSALLATSLAASTAARTRRSLACFHSNSESAVFRRSPPIGTGCGGRWRIALRTSARGTSRAPRRRRSRAAARRHSPR